MSIFDTALPPVFIAGVGPLPCESADTDGGHDGAEHMVYRRRGADVEPTGQQPYRGKLTLAMVNGLSGFGNDVFPGLYYDLLVALESNPIGELRHPTKGTFQAFFKGWKERATPDVRSGVMLDVEFTEHLASTGKLLADQPGQTTPQDAPTTTQALADDADAKMAAADPGTPSAPSTFKPTRPVVDAQLAAIDSNAPPKVAATEAALRTMQSAVGGNLSLPVFAAASAHPAVEALERLSSSINALRDRYLPTRSRSRVYTVPVTMALWQVSLAVYGDATFGTLLSSQNAIPDPLRVAQGTVLLVPPVT